MGRLPFGCAAALGNRPEDLLALCSGLSKRMAWFTRDACAVQAA